MLACQWNEESFPYYSFEGQVGSRKACAGVLFDLKFSQAHNLRKSSKLDRPLFPAWGQEISKGLTRAANEVDVQGTLKPKSLNRETPNSCATPISHM
jgi:hypothetical protein